MMKQGPRKLWFIVIILLTFLSTFAVVGRSQNEGADSFAPTVTATSPTGDASAVTLNQPLTATFSQQMSLPSLSAALVLQRPDGSHVKGTVSSHGRSTMFTPFNNLA